MKSYSERANATREKIKIYKNKAKVRRKNILISVISMCTCLLIALNLVIFMSPATHPGGAINTGEYKNSEYSDVIKELRAIMYGKDMSPAPGVGEGSGGWASGGTGSADDESPNGGGQYVETTDNQVEGVIEGDLIKRTNNYIYYLNVSDDYRHYKLCVYPVAGVETKCIAEFNIEPQSDANYSYYGQNVEMYLSENGATVTLVLPETHREWKNGKYYARRYTEVMNIDVSDLADIKVANRYFVSGEYVSSRLVNGELLLVTDFSVPYNVNFSDESQFVPSTGGACGRGYIPAKHIYCPEKPLKARFTVVCTVNVHTLEETGSEAFLSYSQNVYVSENNIYLTNGYTDLVANESLGLRSNDYYKGYKTKTEISRVEYGGGLNYKGSFTVEGGVINRFCMDEKDGVLRVVTSPHINEYIHVGNHYNHYSTDGASLYCVDIKTYKTVGKLENFAPAEDTVQSARFDGDKVYVCTALVFIMTDPVFAIDVSDYNNIRFVDTGEISGYSIALRKFYGDTLLGIGYDDNTFFTSSGRKLKIELYKETGNTVESAATFIYTDVLNYKDDGHWFTDVHYDRIDVDFSSEYKAYFIDAENGLIGLGLRLQAQDSHNYSTHVELNRYILLQYDGENLNLLMDIKLTGVERSFYNTTRAVYIDGTFYVFTENGLTATELNI